MLANHLILDFSHVYEDENIPQRSGIHWIDCSDIRECDLYCSGRAECEIRRRITPYGIHGIHFLDSGNYHYITKIMTDEIRREFVLIVFDHHTDMQSPMIESMISCGDWAGKILKENAFLQQLVLIGPEQKDMDKIDCKLTQKLLTFSKEEIRSGEGKKKIARIKREFPVYISIDKDILDGKYSETNWSQGEMSLNMLEELAAFFLKGEQVLGIDICGECQQGIPLPQYCEAEEVNGETNRELFAFLGHYL